MIADTKRRASEEDIEAAVVDNAQNKYDEKDDSAPSFEEEVQHLLDENDKSCFLVTIPPTSPDLPMNWAFSYKITITILYGLTTCCAQLTSSIMAPVTSQLEAAYGVSTTVAVLPTSLYILGIAFGPMVFAPFSEVYGRKIGVFAPFFLSILFTIATGASTRIESVIITRFFAGFFAGAPVVSSGGMLSDIWTPAVRGNSLVLYAMFVVLGPTLGSIVGAAINVGTSWHWACWVTAITSGVILTINMFVVRESYVPVLSTRLAKKKRAETNNWLYHAKHEEWELSVHEFLTIHLMRPFAMFRTPIVFFIAIYASFIFGVFYLFLTSAGNTFSEVHGWGQVASSLTYLALFLGTVIGGGLNVIGGKRYARLVNANGGKALPEERLYPMMMVSWLLPVGLFLFGWTQRASIHWIVPCIGLVMFGCGFFVIFQGCLNYLVDSFTRYAASAIAANTFLRSLLAAAFPLFGYRLFANLHPNWGTSLLAFICVAMLPIPYVFYKFGAAVRKRNPYAHLTT